MHHCAAFATLLLCSVIAASEVPLLGGTAVAPVW